MKKAVKIKESDIKQIVSKLIIEGENMEEIMALSKSSPEDGGSVDVETIDQNVELTLAKNHENGDVYILKDAFSDNPEILGVISTSGEIRKAAE